MVTVSDTTTGAIIHCTIDGTPPNSGSPVIGVVQINTPLTLRCYAQASGYSDSGPLTTGYTVSSQAATPLFAIASGSLVTSSATLAISCASPSPTIWYTLDGSAPTTAAPSLNYTTTGAISGSSISTTGTQVKAICTSAGLSTSNVATATYTQATTAALPTFTPGTGLVTAGTSVTLSTVPTSCNAYIYWATHNPPTTADTKGTSFTVSASESVWASVIGCPGYADSASSFANYTTSATQAAKPTYSPSPGTWGQAQTVTITSLTAGSNICYTLDGSTPTATTPPTCTTGIQIPSTGTVSITSSAPLNAIATASGYANSDMQTGQYTIQPGAQTPTLTPGPSSYSAGQTVSPSSPTTGASFCYTTDGTAPTGDTTGACTHGTPVATGGTITVSATEWLYVIAVKSGYAPSGNGGGYYNITGGNPAPTFVAAGTASAVTSGNMSPGIPSGIANNDILILVANGTLTAAPSGWTTITPQNNSLRMFWKRTTGTGETAPSLAMAASTYAATSRIYAFRGCATSGSPIDVQSTAVTSYPINNTMTVPAVTTTLPNDLVLLLYTATAIDPATVSLGTPSASGPVTSAAGTAYTAAGYDGVSDLYASLTAVFYGTKTGTGSTGAALPNVGGQGADGGSQYGFIVTLHP
jgi:hypothetical protein